MMAFNGDLLTRFLPCFQCLPAVLEKCLLGCADTVVSVYGERSPQNRPPAGILVYWKVCSEFSICSRFEEEPFELW